jgi:type II secretory pathway pseudopilin PulG
MAIMSIVMAMFTSGILQIFRTANKNESTSIAQSQLNLTFLRLDKEIRYASGISVPALVGADWYVEFVTVNTGVAVCAELKLVASTGQLLRRQWPQGMTLLAPGPWTPLASGVSAPQPFTFHAADATANFHRLQLRLTARSGAGDSASSTETDVTFTALNTSLATSSAAVCTEGRSVP